MKRKILFMLLSTVLLASCSDNDDGLSPDISTQANGQIRFEIGFTPQDATPETRAATSSDFKTTWEVGDQIGIFAVKSGNPLSSLGNPIHNMKVTFDGTSWNGAYWPNDLNKNENLDFYAYYPYDASMTDPNSYTFNVQHDQSSETNYNKSDLLLSTATNQGKGTAAVSLQFKHAMSMVQVEVKREVNVPYFTDDLTVTLKGANTDAVLCWGVDLSGTGTPVDIVMHKVAGMTNTYRVLVPAHTLSSDVKVTFVQTTSGKEIDMEYQGLQLVTLVAKGTRKYIVTLGWGIDPTHAYVVGDVYPHTGPALGIVFWVDPASDGKHGKLVSLQEKSSLSWSTSNVITGAIYESNGLANMQTIYAFANDFMSYPAFSWVHNLNSVSEDYSNPDATGVWYLPALNELLVLYTAKSVLNSSLSAVSGSNQLSEYWSSTEIGTYAYDVNFSNSDKWMDNKNEQLSVRAVSAF